MAAELRSRVLALREKQWAAETNALAACRLAGAYQDAGQAQKAVATYERVLDAGTNHVPAWARILAQLRTASLYEKLGQREKARAAYQNLTAMRNQGDYSARVADEAERRLAVLAPAGKKEE